MRSLLVAGASLALIASVSPLAARGPLSFEERVKAQEAIERVYYAHRIWPKENPGPKPPFEQAVTREMLEAKVTDYLKKSAALDQFWQQPIEPEQLQAEMERIVESTKDPATLRELFAALHDDPESVAECLARPALTDRLLSDWYASDTRFHAELKRRAEGALAAGTRSWPREEGARYACGSKVLDEDPEDPLLRADEDAGTQRLSKEAFQRWVREAPAEGESLLRESREGFLLVATAHMDERRWEGETCFFSKRGLSLWWEEAAQHLSLEGPSAPQTPSAPYRLPVGGGASACALQQGWERKSALVDVVEVRSYHTAVWTGSEMIVWGGKGDGHEYETGSRYNPATDSWMATPIGTNCPTARYTHTAVWTGTEMIIWGGNTNTGGRYNPSTDSWLPTSTQTNCPVYREGHTAVWTGTEMIIWGGQSSTYQNTGGRYNPSTDSWAPTSTATNCPISRMWHTAVWTGSQMIVWGGYWVDSITGIQHYEKTGGKYDPTTDSWTTTSTSGNCPPGSQFHTAVWTGSEMIVWGGSGSTGGRYTPSTDSWVLTSTGANCPASRSHHTAVWTGTWMIVWGGADSYSNPLNTGGQYNPETNVWKAISTANCPAIRWRHSAVWTGSQMIVWGGEGYTYKLATGGRYNLATNSWTPTSLGPGNPEARYSHTAVWTGSEMIIWGGGNISFSPINTGRRYSPATDSWAPTSTGTNCPSTRYNHTALWTGSEMIVWGGSDANTGGRYNPLTDSWSATSAGANCPTRRYGHTAVWTGSEMIVWGGYSGHYYNSGGRYSPATNAWLPTSTGTNCPTTRQKHTAVWTGSEMIVWGGYWQDSTNHWENTGARYNPTTDSWTPTSTDARCPRNRTGHSAVWTGSEMIVWGGYYYISGSGGYDNTGGRYNPSTDSWAPTPLTAGCPRARDQNTAVWTGSEMIVWGGYGTSGSEYYENTGGRYIPADDAWIPTSTDPNCPEARRRHTAVWTGSKMIVWGGDAADYRARSTGGIFTPEVAVSGPSSVCVTSGGVLATQMFTGYQWHRDGVPLPGATARTYTAHQAGTYTVTVTDSGGCTGTSPGKVVTLDSPPVSPGASLRVTGGASLGLSWDSCAGADSYAVRINNNPGASPEAFSLLGTTAATSYTDAIAIPAGQIYWYSVEALSGSCATP